MSRESAPQSLVERGYDAAAHAHLDWLTQITGDPRMDYLDQLIRRLPDSANVLDLGCGAGIPVTAKLAESFDVTGLDISQTQLDLARSFVPNATFIRTDMASYQPSIKFEAVTALYSVSHLPRSSHLQLFSQIAGWLKPGGFLLASLGATGCPDVVDNWLGVPMFFSSFDADENRRLVRQAGFELLMDDVVTMNEPEGEATFLWVLGQI